MVAMQTEWECVLDLRGVLVTQGDQDCCYPSIATARRVEESRLDRKQTRIRMQGNDTL